MVRTHCRASRWESAVLRHNSPSSTAYQNTCANGTKAQGGCTTSHAQCLTRQHVSMDTRASYGPLLLIGKGPFPTEDENQLCHSCEYLDGCPHAGPCSDTLAQDCLCRSTPSCTPSCTPNLPGITNHFLHVVGLLLWDLHCHWYYSGGYQHAAPSPIGRLNKV
jgi:hypothetical protein